MLFWEKNLRKRVESLVETDNSPLSLDEMSVFMLCGENTFSDIFLKNKENNSFLKRKTFLENILEKLSKSRNFAAIYKAFK